LSLERYAQAQFDLAISKGQARSDLAEIAVGKIAIGLAEMRRVGGIELTEIAPIIDTRAQTRSKFF
jgi:hypothetical protein